MAEELLMKSRFVSEAALEEKRKQRQSEWERVRQPEDPVECPEEEYDARSLFERLQEQKDKKQAEYDEQFKFKNMVRGLETDEVDFLSEVSKQQELLDRRRIIEDRRAILEYRDAVVRRASALEKELPDRSDKRAMAVAVTAAAAAPAAPAEAKLKPKPRPSQTQLLAAAAAATAQTR
uniref:PSME3-interacting protein isoform X3 n=1 Tax=Petromyzon marinus TaxID=7757 RepID=A0AAJ7XI18_PETMA|nr:PSME3-interacting protein isoform X3 [Petromyzon marinus]